MPHCFQFHTMLFPILHIAVSNSAPLYFQFCALLYPIPCPAANSAPRCFKFRALLFQILCPTVSNSVPRCFKFRALLFPIPCPAVSNSMPCCFKLCAPLFQILCPADVSHSIINLEQACVLTELTQSKSYLMWDKESYILQATTQLMAMWPPLASQPVSSKWAILTKRFVMEYVKKVCLLVQNLQQD